MQARFSHGAPVMLDYTPGSDVAAGDVIITNDTVRIAHLDIPSGRLGSLAAEGGVYEVSCDAAIAADKKVYWNDSTNEVTETAGSNKVFGVTEEASTGSDQTIKVRHDPAA